VTNSKRSVALAAALTLFALLLAGCLLPSDNGSGGDGGLAEPAPVNSNPGGGGGRSLEGAFTYDTMDQYVDAVLPMIEDWLKETWPGMSMPEVIYVPAGTAGREGCEDADGRPASATSQSYEFCPADNRVYVGQDTLWEFYTETGDAGPAVGLAHEFGHHVQVELNLPPVRTTDQSIRYENQADCLAGAWTEWTDEKGYLEREDDLQDIEALFPLIGSAEGPDRDHGTAKERRNAFETGFNGGITACGVHN
jgi:predicted metalloprotease